MSKLYGTLDALILKTLSRGSMHGYAVARWLEERTGEAIQVEESSLYPALYRLEGRGLLRSRWGRTDHDRRAKFYELTGKGEKALARETREWETFAEAVSQVLLVDG